MSKNISNPFVGLQTYSRKNSADFFGREQEVENLLQILQKNKLLTLSGDAGSGKTSFINASLIPRLQNGFVGQVGKDWSIAYFRPSSNPLSNLAHSLTKNEVLNIETKAKTTDYKHYSKIIKEFEAAGLVEIYKQSEIYDKKNLLIIIDQLEDLFKFKEYFDPANSQDDHKLMDMIYRSVSYKNMSIYFLLSIESNYLTKITSFKKLQEIVTPSQYTIQNLDYVKINHILEKTFYEHEVYFDQPALDYFQEHLDEKASYLPNFQFLLCKLFQQYVIQENENNLIDLDCIEKLGGIPNVIANDLEAYHLKLQPKEQNELSLFFKFLTKPHHSSTGANYEKTGSISENMNLDIEEVSKNINALKNSFYNLIEVCEPSISGIKNNHHRSYEAESILNLKYIKYLNWSRRQEWIKDEKNDFLIYKKISEDAIKKDNGQIDFIKTLALQSAITWRNNPNHNESWAKRFGFNFTKTVKYINDSEQDDLRIKKEKEDQLERERKKERIKRKVYLILGIGMLILTTIALFQKRAATEASVKARKNKDIADSLKTIAQDDAKINLALKLKTDTLLTRANELRQTSLELADGLEKEKKELTKTLANLRISEKDRASKRDSIIRIIDELGISNAKAIKESEKNRITRELIELKYAFNDLKLDLNTAFQEKDKEKIKSLIAESIDKQQKFNLLRSQEGIPYINDENVIALNKKTLAILETKQQYSETSMRLEKSDNAIRNFNIYENKIAFGGDKGELQFYDLINEKELTTINIAQNNIEDRIRNVKFLNGDTLFVTTFSGKVLKVTRSTSNIKTIYKSDDVILDFFIDRNKGTQHLVLKNKIISYSADQSIIHENSEYRNIETSFYKDSYLIFISDEKLYVLDHKGSEYKIIANFKLANTNNASSIYLSDTYLFVGTANGEVKCFDFSLSNSKNLKSPLLRHEFNQHSSRVSNLYYDEDETAQILYTASLDNKIFRYDFKLSQDTQIKKAIIELVGHEKWIWHLETYTDKMGKKLLLTADEDGNLLSWHTNIDDLLSKIKVQFESY
jgi:hypothetical protein